MKTEELNEYVFADLVSEKAFRMWNRDTSNLVDQGLSVDEAIDKNPAIDTYFPAAIAALIETRQRVFELLKGSD